MLPQTISPLWKVAVRGIILRMVSPRNEPPAKIIASTQQFAPEGMLTAIYQDLLYRH
jgi:hypothetical protein